jgi:xylulokinase
LPAPIENFYSMPNYIAAVDCGTTAVKTALFDLKGKIIAITSRVVPCLYHPDGGVEQDTALILKAIYGGLKATLESSNLNPGQIIALSLSTQRATLICTDKRGKALGKAISWQDLRGAREIEALQGSIKAQSYYKITGLPPHPVFSLGKILWLKKHNPELFARAARFSLVHDFVLSHLGCSEPFLDCSNASLTGILDVSKLSWSKTLLELSGISPDKLPVLAASGKAVGRLSPQAASRCGMLAGTPLITGGGDQQCAGIGAGASLPGIIAITLGTAATSMCCSPSVRLDPKMRLSCCAHAIPGTWELEGLQNSAGASLQWLQKILGEPRLSAEQLRAVAKLKPGSNGVSFFPYLSGAGAPYWNPQATALFLGLRHNHSQADLIRAVMEGVSLETLQILKIFTALKIPVQEIRLNGGYSRMEVWNQIQSDIYGRRVSILSTPEASLLGAALLGAWGAGAFKTLAEASKHMIKLTKRYEPDAANTAVYAELYAKYCALYESLEHSRLWPKVAI